MKKEILTCLSRQGEASPGEVYQQVKNQAYSKEDFRKDLKTLLGEKKVGFEKKVFEERAILNRTIKELDKGKEVEEVKEQFWKLVRKEVPLNKEAYEKTVEFCREECEPGVDCAGTFNSEDYCPLWKKKNEYLEREKKLTEVLETLKEFSSGVVLKLRSKKQVASRLVKELVESKGVVVSKLVAEKIGTSTNFSRKVLKDLNKKGEIDKYKHSELPSGLKERFKDIVKEEDLDLSRLHLYSYYTETGKGKGEARDRKNSGQSRTSKILEGAF